MRDTSELGRVRDRGLGHRCWYEIVYWSCAFLSIFGLGLRVLGRRRLPRRGPCLIIANHQSFLDPTLVGLAAPRQLCYLARKTLFRRRLLALFIRSVNAVPIDHKGLGIDGLKTVLALLAEGEAVVVFPEGTRSVDGRLQPLEPGIQLLVKRGQVPVVPVGIAGAFDSWPRTRRFPWPLPLFLPAFGGVAVVVGPPLSAEHLAALPRDQLLATLARQMHDVQQRAERLRRKA